MGSASICDIKVEIGVKDPLFMMSSLRSVVGEKVTNLFERSIISKSQVIIFVASGGVRMQEDIIVLMQMAKTSPIIAKYSQETEGLYISVLINPTTGGVSASSAFLGDIVLTEPSAIIGFAGKRIIE